MIWKIDIRVVNLLIAALLLGQAVQAAPLKGGVSLDHNLESAPMRIARPTNSNFNYGRGSMDTPAPPLAGRAATSGSPLKGILNDNDFAGQKPQMDLGEEAQSREMLLAWERWHKQLSGTIYQRWSDVARTAGMATVRITVTNNNTISANIINSTGGPDFDRGLIASIRSLDGNAGLSFPSGSKRTVVTYQADYIAGRNVNPGYTWVKNDYERVRQN